jgi:flagellar basal-body rod modification protein FlgD
LQAAGLVGQYVSVPGKEALLTAGGNVKGDFNLSSSVPNATLTITDPNTNTTIFQKDLGAQKAGDVPFAWDGRDNNGALANPGLYNVQVTALIGGKNTAVATNIDSKVTSVSMGSNGSGLQVDLLGLGSVPFSNVKKII